ncbi:MAG: acetolactate synthase small subunit [Candidatus Promineifilaceae bacterium]
MRHTLIAIVENKPGVLNRVSSLFRRRNFNIDALNVGRTENPDISRMTITVDSENVDAARVEANLYKLVNVVDVQEVSGEQAVLRELALIKLDASISKRQEIITLAQVFGATISDVGPDTMIVQAVDRPTRINSIIEALRPYGIIELVRTGNVAMLRGHSEGTRHTPGTGNTVSYMDS